MNEATAALPELVTKYYGALRELAELTLAVLEHDTEENRRRAWHFAHLCLGHESWEGRQIDGSKFVGEVGVDLPAVPAAGSHPAGASPTHSDGAE